LSVESGTVSERFGALRESVILVQQLPRGADGECTGEFTLEPVGVDAQAAVGGAP
jgi:hypothetical protein